MRGQKPSAEIIYIVLGTSVPSSQKKLFLLNDTKLNSLVHHKGKMMKSTTSLMLYDGMQQLSLLSYF